MSRTISAFVVLEALIGSPGVRAQDLEERATQVLKSSCSFCHGDGEETHGNLENILDFANLEVEGLIDAESPEESRILERMRDTANPMPPSDAPSDHVRTPSKDDILLVEKWLVDRAGKSKKRLNKSDGSKSRSTQLEQGLNVMRIYQNLKRSRIHGAQSAASSRCLGSQRTCRFEAWKSNLTNR